MKWNLELLRTWLCPKSHAVFVISYITNCIPVHLLWQNVGSTVECKVWDTIMWNWKRFAQLNRRWLVGQLVNHLASHLRPELKQCSTTPHSNVRCYCFDMLNRTLVPGLLVFFFNISFYVCLTHNGRITARASLEPSASTSHSATRSRLQRKTASRWHWFVHIWWTRACSGAAGYGKYPNCSLTLLCKLMYWIINI